MTRITFYVDGGMLGPRNPSPEGIRWSVWCDPPGDVVIRKESDQYHTNNEAEYFAVIEALKYAKEHHPDAEVTIFSDSQLIVNQLLGKFRCNLLTLRRLKGEATERSRDFSSCRIAWCPRDVMVEKVGH